MWRMFTKRAQRVVFFAQEEAGRMGHNYVATEHLLLGLLRENDSVAARILDRMGFSLSALRQEIERQMTQGDGRLGQDMQLTPRAKRMIDFSYDEARQLSNKYIGTEHLLLATIRDEGIAGKVLTEAGVDLERTRREVLQLQDSDSGYAPQNVHAKKFAEAYANLSAEQKRRLRREGLPLSQLPPTMWEIIQRIFEANTPTRAFVLDPNATLRVDTASAEEATHFTLTASASFVTHLRVPTKET